MRIVRRNEFRWEIESNKKESIMLWTIAVLLVIMWMLGMVTSYTLAGFIHVLLVVALVVVVLRVFQGRRAV